MLTQHPLQKKILIDVQRRVLAGAGQQMYYGIKDIALRIPLDQIKFAAAFFNGNKAPVIGHIGQQPGHDRGFAQAGNDIVCASISVLVINAINSIEQFAGEKMSVITNEEEGLIDVRFANPVNEKTTLLMDSLLLGLREVKEQYGSKYLKLQFEEV